MKYMIHACNNRMWYVNGYLVPSMLEQGIKEADIFVYQDTECDGNLVSWVVSCHKAWDMWEEQNIWHLQDDVLICRDFKERTEKLEDFDGIVQGFACKYDKNIPSGECLVGDFQMWFSFPCIRIPNKITKLSAEWADLWVWKDPQYGFWIRHKKGDDMIFKVYAESYQREVELKKLAPNLVEHVDWLLGGSEVNKQRGKEIIRSAFWNDEALVEELKNKLNL